MGGVNKICAAILLQSRYCEIKKSVTLAEQTDEDTSLTLVLVICSFAV